MLGFWIPMSLITLTQSYSSFAFAYLPSIWMPNSWGKFLPRLILEHEIGRCGSAIFRKIVVEE